VIISPGRFCFWDVAPATCCCFRTTLGSADPEANSSVYRLRAVYAVKAQQDCRTPKLLAYYQMANVPGFIFAALAGAGFNSALGERLVRFSRSPWCERSFCGTFSTTVYCRRNLRGTVRCRHRRMRRNSWSWIERRHPPSQMRSGDDFPERRRPRETLSSQTASSGAS